MKLLYIAGPYKAPTEQGIRDNIARAREVATRLVDVCGVIVPHNMSEGIEAGDFEEADEYWLQVTSDLMSKCDGVFVLPGSGGSAGTQAEVERAERLGIPVMHTLEEARTWAKEQTLAERSLLAFGWRAQEVKVMEEMSECVAAMARCISNQPSIDAAEEFADVEICLEQMRRIYGNDWHNQRAKKRAKWRNAIERREAELEKNAKEALG